MKGSNVIREAHDLTRTVARHYAEKYGAQAASMLEEAARGFEENEYLHNRNKMLRLQDEVLMLTLPLTAG